MTPAARLRRLNAAATVTWLLMTVPTMVWWRQSIAWVSFMSIYAIVVSHYTAWQASRAEVAADEND